MPRILIADDDPMIIRLLEIVLRQKGYDVITADDGVQALAAALSQNPDLVILDGMMPGLDGIEVLRRLRESEACKAVPVIMLSARTQQDEIDDGLSLGTADYLVKPVESKAVIASVERLLPLRPT